MICADDQTRGVTRITQFELRTRYPLWLVSTPGPMCRAAIAGHLRRAGAPRAIAPCRQGLRRVTGSRAWPRRRGDEDFSGLRAYAAGRCRLKHMAWKVLARGGEPVVRSYSELRRRNPSGWNGQDLLEGMDTEARLSQLCLSGCWKVRRCAKAPTVCEAAGQGALRPRAARRTASPACERSPHSRAAEK